jgi:hypothetical protein
MFSRIRDVFRAASVPHAVNSEPAKEVTEEITVADRQMPWRSPFEPPPKPLSAKELCKLAEDLWHEVGRARFEKEWDNELSTHCQIIAVYQLTHAVTRLLDRTNLTPESTLWAYWGIRCALDGLGFTREREQEVHEEEEERVADVRFLREHGTCFPEYSTRHVEPKNSER